VNVCVYLVGSVVNKFTPASYELFPLRYDNHDAYLCDCAWPSRQNKDDSCIGMYVSVYMYYFYYYYKRIGAVQFANTSTEFLNCQSSECVMVSVLFYGT